MSGDDKPSRFAMISEEMVNPPELKSPSNQIISDVIVTGTSTRVFTGSKAVFLINGEQVKFASGVFGSEEFPNSTDVSLDPGGLSWSGEATVCPRCKLGAFELMLPDMTTNQVRITCLRCPPPAPTYYIPEGTEVRVNPYRCCRCDCRPRVTMTLSEVNLHCRVCKQLTLHTRQDSAPKKSTSVMSFLVDESLKTSLFSWVKVKPEDSPFTWDDFDKPSERQSVDARFENTTLGVPYQPETKLQDVDKLVERMRVALKLENFFDFAQKRRRMNAELVVQGAYDDNDIARRSGRTTRGLLEALARCVSDNKREVVIRGGSAREEVYCFMTLKDILLNIANSSDRDLRISTMVKASKHSDDPNRMYRRDAIVYVDHTYNTYNVR